MVAGKKVLKWFDLERTIEVWILRKMLRIKNKISKKDIQV
jgi:hypothetical protein